MKIFTVSAWFFTIMPPYDSFLSLQSTPWFQAEFDLTLAALGKSVKKAARGVRFKSGLPQTYTPNTVSAQWLATIRQATHSSLRRTKLQETRSDPTPRREKWSMITTFSSIYSSKRNNNSRNSYTSKNMTFSSDYHLLLVSALQ